MEIDEIIADVTQRLQHINGVEAIVLGGSRARNTHTTASDIDIGIYYSSNNPIDLYSLEKVAAEIDDEHRAGIVTSIGEWGPWINGGGWLKVAHTPVDFLYRDLEQVESIISDCCNGLVQIYYQPGHPHGFITHIYMAEIALCKPLWDPNGKIASLKELTSPYPPLLKEAIIKKFHWESHFSILIARKAIKRGDLSYAAGCCFRAVACLMQTLFAINEQYCMNEKGSVTIASSFPLSLDKLQVRINSAFENLSAKPEAISNSIEILNNLILETESKYL
jgi:hypothetical protein